MKDITRKSYRDYVVDGLTLLLEFFVFTKRYFNSKGDRGTFNGTEYNRVFKKKIIKTRDGGYMDN